jgi:hypothetical protein
MEPGAYDLSVWVDGETPPPPIRVDLESGPNEVTFER